MKAFLASLLMLVAGAVSAQALEHEVKAAFLFKFLSFIDWPASVFPGPASPLVVGVAGAEDLAAELEQVLPGRAVNGRPVVLRRLREGEPATGVHVLYLGRREAALLRDPARLAPTQPVLTVCDWEGALDQGCVINFVRSDGRVRFEVALDAAERRGLHISSRMLAVAQHVRQGRL